MAPGGGVHFLPNIAGFVGGDHVAMLLASRLADPGPPALGVDIGTNTEITLRAGDRLLCCSCASGPAFEGAHIYAGMRAAPGAVEYVKITGDDVRVQTIGGRPAVGICGSGILDAVAELCDAGIVTPAGRFKQQHPG